MSAANAIALAGWVFIWKGGFMMGEGHSREIIALSLD